MNNNSTFLSVFAAGMLYNKTRIYSTNLLPSPKYYKEILNYLYKAGFQAALEKEYNNLVQKEIFKVVPEADTGNKTIIPTMTVFIYKLDKEGYLL